MTHITIQPIKSVEHCLHFQELERRIWQGGPEDMMPIHVLITVAKNGGGVLGAYAPDGPPELDGMVGMALWWHGVGQRDGVARVKVCSHMAGVLPAWQGRGVGLRLKLAQRELILQQGITDWVTWTYDPLYRPNGVLNIHRLGATCNPYYPNHYGEMTDALNAGAPSDRCQVDWDLRSERVLAAIDHAREAHVRHPTYPGLQVLPTKATSNGLRQPVNVTFPCHSATVAVPLPDDIGAIRRQDQALGLAWRFYIRQLFETAFGAGYNLVDCIHLPEQGWHYILNYTQ
jgi:predicted GNAT superfamily acetyltransferase